MLLTTLSQKDGMLLEAGELHSHHTSEEDHSVAHYLGRRTITLTY